MWQILSDNLPHLTAALNATAVVFLARGLMAIRVGNARKHKKMMLSAFTVSMIFLVFYLFHKVALHQVTGQFNSRYPSDPAIAPTWSRYTYLAILATHIPLAMLVPPLAMWAIYLAKNGRIVTHKKVVRWTYPIWMYVSVTGVLVYVLLYHHQTFFG